MDQFKRDLKNNAGSSTDLNLLRMLESRIVEVIQIEKEVKKKYPKLFTQRLPRYMRRRAASHNANRIPKWLRCSTSKRAQNKLTAKDRRRLYKYRERIRHAKSKRVLRRHSQNKFKDPNKSILHKWFAKRFKMETKQLGLEWVPLHNNTKNFRNLYRQTRYGCAYFSLAHLVAFRVEATLDTATIKTLNQFCHPASGFTFAARSLENGRYEIVIHLYETKLGEKKSEGQHEHVCPALVAYNVQAKRLTMWVPRLNVARVQGILKATNLVHEMLPPRETVRIRLMGPYARKEAMKISVKMKVHEEAIFDVDRRLLASHKLGLTIGRHIEETSACFTYYQTDPQSVDIVIRNKALGRMLWHKMIKNKAHLVGGKRDVDELFKEKECFQLKPDCC